MQKTHDRFQFASVFFSISAGLILDSIETMKKKRGILFSTNFHTSSISIITSKHNNDKQTSRKQLIRGKLKNVVANSVLVLKERPRKIQVKSVHIHIKNNICSSFTFHILIRNHIRVIQSGQHSYQVRYDARLKFTFY